MANNIRNVLKAKNLHTIWDGKDFESIIPSDETQYHKFISKYDPTGIYGWRRHNWGSDGRIFYSSAEKPDIIFMLTASTTPWRIVQKISERLGDTPLYHEFSDQDNYNRMIVTIIWCNGRIIECKAVLFDFNIDGYSEPFDINPKKLFPYA